VLLLRDVASSVVAGGGVVVVGIAVVAGAGVVASGTPLQYCWPRQRSSRWQKPSVAIQSLREPSQSLAQHWHQSEAPGMRPSPAKQRRQSNGAGVGAGVGARVTGCTSLHASVPRQRKSLAQNASSRTQLAWRPSQSSAQHWHQIIEPAGPPPLLH
jgi:hypothetical protein